MKNSSARDFFTSLKTIDCSSSPLHQRTWFTVFDVSYPDVVVWNRSLSVSKHTVSYPLVFSSFGDSVLLFQQTNVTIHIKNLNHNLDSNLPLFTRKSTVGLYYHKIHPCLSINLLYNISFNFKKLFTKLDWNNYQTNWMVFKKSMSRNSTTKIVSSRFPGSKMFKRNWPL